MKLIGQCICTCKTITYQQEGLRFDEHWP